MQIQSQLLSTQTAGIHGDSMIALHIRSFCEFNYLNHTLTYIDMHKTSYNMQLFNYT